MVKSPKGLGPKKDYAGECQQHIQKSDPPLVREDAHKNRAVIVKY
jgi:hypothetical protein